MTDLEVGFCTALVTAPHLPATALAKYCYWGMFDNCTSLTNLIHCAASTKSDSNKLVLKNSGTAEIVFDL